jgi:Domain of unknown function (DUF4126)
VLAPLVLSNGWAAGVNAYAVVVMLGLAGRLGLADAPEPLMRTDVLVAAGALYAVEFVTDKIPYVDSVWDAIHTAIRPTIAAVLGALLAGDAETLTQALAAAGAGATALASHAVKAGLRVAINSSPEPVTNVTASLLEDALVAVVVVLALSFPWIALAVAAALLAGGLVLVYRLLRRMRRWRLRAPFAPQAYETSSSSEPSGSRK